MMSKKKPAPKRAKAKQERKNIVVTVDEDHLPHIQKVATRLRSLGMTVDGVMESIGIISGSVPMTTADLQSIPGVASVEEQTQFQVPPPDAPVK